MIEEIFSISFNIKTKQAKSLKELLELEMCRKAYTRSSSKIFLVEQGINIQIFARDVVAFKATINNYINILELISKVYEVNLNE